MASLYLALAFCFLVGMSSGMVVCPDKESQCPEETTCCLLEGGEYGCCPIANAVCCEDKLHCCPEATTCDLQHLRCIRGTRHFPIHTKHSSQPIRVSQGRLDIAAEYSATSGQDEQLNHRLGLSSQASPTALNDQVEHQKLANHHQLQRQQNVFSEEEICPDGKSKCPSHTTCCPLNGEQAGYVETDFVAPGPVGEVDTIYGCCPAEHAVCCADKLHCCPEGTHCDTQESRCVQAGTGFSRPWQRKFASTKIVRKPAVALDGASQQTCHSRLLNDDDLWSIQKENGAINQNYYALAQCPSGSKCCLHTSHGFGASTDQTKATCCPFSDGECCAGGTHCCPGGFRCTSLDGKCVKVGERDGVVLSMHFKPTTPAVLYLSTNEVTSTEVVCGDGSRCAPLNSCCPVFNSVTNAIESYGCCPLSKANCCSDTCCPIGYSCAEGRKCEKSSLAERISHWAAADRF